MDSIFFYRNPEDAVAQGGPLQDLTLAIQPNISVAGWPTDAGSKALSGFTALEDATMAQRLHQAGARFWGSTRMSEFGFGLRDSAAGLALRERVVDAELVLDLMGESRQAALSASVCGFKPSYGLVSRFGLVGLIPSMECCGILCSNLKTARAMMKVMAGRDEKDFSLPDEPLPDFSLEGVDPSRTTVGVVAEAIASLPDGSKALMDSAVAELEQAGCAVREVSLPGFSLFPLVHQIVGSVEGSSCAGRYDSVRYGVREPGARNWNEMYLLSRGAAFGGLLKSYLFQGAFFQFERYDAYEDACRVRGRLLEEIRQISAQADFLVLPAAGPSACGAPESLADTYVQFAATLFANVTGQPSLCLPQSAHGGCAGFQLSGPRLSDARLLALGEHLLGLRQGGR